MSIVDAGTPSSAQTPTDGNTEQAAAPSSDAKTPEIGATVSGNGDLRPRDDSAAQAASSVASSAVEAASSAGSGDATSSVLGGTLDASKAQGIDTASSATPQIPVENAQAPSSGVSIPSVSTPQDAKPGGSSGVNLPQIGVNGLEGAVAPVGFVEQGKGPGSSGDVQPNDFYLIGGWADGVIVWADNLDEAKLKAKAAQNKRLEDQANTAKDDIVKYILPTLVNEAAGVTLPELAESVQAIDEFLKTRYSPAERLQVWQGLNLGLRGRLPELGAFTRITPQQLIQVGRSAAFANNLSSFTSNDLG